MYPLDSIYGPRTYREFEREKRLTRQSLKDTQQTATER
jgi:hypothetical protein